MEKWTTFEACAIAEGFASTEPTIEEYLGAWAYLISTGACWSLQGWYGRTAKGFIDNGVITKTGEIDWDVVEDLKN